MAKSTVINWSALCKVLGWLLLVESIFMLIPLFVCLWYGEDDWLAFLIGAGLAAAVGGTAVCAIHPRSESMGKREGFLLTAVVWVLFSLFGMVPLLISAVPLSVTEAFFEAVSGFTATGATVIGKVSELSYGVVMWRSVMQWLGGMGIILFTLAVLPMFNHSGGLMMFNAEVTGITHDKLRPRIAQTAKWLWFEYITLTGLLVVLLWVGPMGFFESVCHAFATISTGGYSTADAGLSTWDSSIYVKLVITVFMFIGGINFSLIFATVTTGWRTLWRNDIFRLYVYSIIVMFVLFDILIIVGGNYHSAQDVLIEPLFQIVSTITSTGYTVSNFEAWGTTVLLLVFVMMFTGACAGSTSGGAKLDRIRCIIAHAHNQLRQVISPRAIYTVRVNGRVVTQETLNKIMAFLVLYMLVIFVSSILLTAMDVPLVDAFFSTFSCISNVGIGAGITGYGSNYDIIPEAGKWVLAFVMIIGRLEIFTFFVLLTSNFWHKK